MFIVIIIIIISVLKMIWVREIDHSMDMVVIRWEYLTWWDNYLLIFFTSLKVTLMVMDEEYMKFSLKMLSVFRRKNFTIFFSETLRIMQIFRKKEVELEMLSRCPSKSRIVNRFLIMNIWILLKVVDAIKTLFYYISLT